MKTKTSFHYSNFPLPIAGATKAQIEKMTVRMVQKSDLKNHRFSLIDNKSIHDPINWDSSWFAHYE